MGNNQERYIAGQTRYARNNPAGVKRSLYGVFRLFCNIIPAIRRFRHLLKLLSFQTSSLVEHLISLSYRNFLNRICFILPKYAANIAKHIFSLLFLVYFFYCQIYIHLPMNKEFTSTSASSIPSTLSISFSILV